VTRRRAPALLSLAALAWVAAACTCHTLRAANPAAGVRLPRDHAAHGDAQTEWWHFHGHLVDDDGRRYDFFLGFVKQHTDLDRVLFLPVRWFVDPFQLAYFTVADRSAQTFTVREKHAYPDTWAASADERRLDLRHDSFTARALDDGWISLAASTRRERMTLRIRSTRAAALLGRQGYLEIPPRSSHYYYSLPIMEAEGTIHVQGEERRVRGTAWLKHEWGFLIDDDIAGFVWFGVQLSSGPTLEIGLIFDRGWDLRQGSFAVVEEEDGRVVPIELHELGVAESGRIWRSPRTDTVYPIGWVLDVPGRGRLILDAVIPGQEMVVFPANLWAGTLDVQGVFDDELVTGSCFTEVVGLKQPFGRSLLRTGRPR
jgi:predicted secreted hydrolase